MTDLLPVTDSVASPIASTEHEPCLRERTRVRVVLDTSVLIADPDCIGTFEESDIVVPLTVIEELDGLKNRPDDVGRAARSTLRRIEDLRIRHGGSLAEPVAVGTSSLRIEINNVQKHRLIEHGLDPASPDNRIIGAALGQAEHGPTTMVSNDATLASRRLTSASTRPSTGARRGTPTPPPSAGRRSRPASRSSTASMPPARSTPT